jgi:hypothetical protein
MTRAEFGTYGVAPRQHEEGELTKRLEHFTSLVPSGAYLTLAFAACGLAVGLYATGRKDAANFVGHWAPTILVIGLYNKLVKLHGSD